MSQKEVRHAVESYCCTAAVALLQVENGPCKMQVRPQKGHGKTIAQWGGHGKQKVWSNVTKRNQGGSLTGVFTNRLRKFSRDPNCQHMKSAPRCWFSQNSQHLWNHCNSKNRCVHRGPDVHQNHPHKCHRSDHNKLSCHLNPDLQRQQVPLQSSCWLGLHTMLQWTVVWHVSLAPCVEHGKSRNKDENQSKNVSESNDNEHRRFPWARLASAPATGWVQQLDE